MLSHFSRVQLFATLWTIACYSSSMGFSRQEYWCQLPCPLPRDLPVPGIKPTSLTTPVLAGRFFAIRATWEDQNTHVKLLQSSLTLQIHVLSPSRLLCPSDSAGKNTGVGCHALLQGIFPTEGSNPCLLCLLNWQAGSLPWEPPCQPQISYTPQLKKRVQK